MQGLILDPSTLAAANSQANYIANVVAVGFLANISWFLLFAFAGFAFNLLYNIERTALKMGR